MTLVGNYENNSWGMALKAGKVVGRTGRIMCLGLDLGLDLWNLMLTYGFRKR